MVLYMLLVKMMMMVVVAMATVRCKLEGGANDASYERAR